MNSSIFEQGNIVIGNLPYSDFSEIVRRPLLVASSDEYNTYSDDIIAIKVTSKVKDRPYAIELTNKDLESGHLKMDSSVKVDSIFFISKKLLSTPIAKVKTELMNSVKDNLKSIFLL